MPTQPSTTIGTVPGNVQNATSGSGKGTAVPVPPSTPLAYGGGANESLALQQFLAQMNARQNSYWNNPAAPAVPVTPPVVTPPPDTGDETPPPVVEPFGPKPFGKPKKEKKPKYKIPFPNIQPGQTLSDYMLDVNQYMAEVEAAAAEKKRLSDIWQQTIGDGRDVSSGGGGGGGAGTGGAFSSGNSIYDPTTSYY